MSGLVSVTVEMLRGELTAAELGAIPGAVLGGESGAVDGWLAEKLVQACDRVVLALNSCRENVAVRTGLCRVPAGCLRTVLVLARHAVIAALPGLSDVLEGGSRSAEYATACRELDALARCELRPEYALAADEVADGGGGCGFGFIFGERVDDFRW